MSFISNLLKTYLVYRFADRDMVMRFRGGGVGHKSTRSATDFFKNDRDSLDRDRRRAKIDTENQSNGDSQDATDSDSEQQKDFGMELVVAMGSHGDVEDEAGSVHVEELEAVASDDEEGDEEDDYTYVRDISDSSNDEDSGSESDRDLSDDMLGPEDGICTVDNEMDELGYADF
jgi:hypothetical protein